MSGASNTRVFTVFYGEEDYLLDRELMRALKWPDRMVTHLDGGPASEDDVVSALEEMTLDGSKIVVVLDNAQKVKISKEFPAYLERRDVKDKSSLLVAICRSAALPKGWDKVASKGRAIEHPKFKPWEDDKFRGRLQKEASLFGLTVNEQAASLLLKLHKDDSCQMANEVRKLSFLVERGGEITLDLVRAICAQRYTVFPWDVAEEAVQRRSRPALLYTSLLFQEKGDEAAVPIVAALMKQVERLLLLRSMVDQNQTPETMGGVLGLHPYVVKKTLPVVQGYTVVRLRDQMQKLCELEVQVKGPASSKRTLVELAVLSLAA